jgi:hypothetical protein
VNLETISPRETSGSSTQARFSYQQEVIAHYCIDMLQNDFVKKIFCDFHSDCVIEYADGFLNYLQIKGFKNKLFGTYDLKDASNDMFSNFITAQGKCKNTLITNSQLERTLKGIIQIIEDKKRLSNISSEDLDKLEKWKNELKETLKNNHNLTLFDDFIDRMEIKSEFPSFSETLVANTITLTDYNVANLRNVLNDKMENNFKKEDVRNIYNMICKEIEKRSKITTKYDRYLDRDILLNRIHVPSFQRILFSNNLTKADVDRLKGQSVLEGKLEKGGFKKEFIENAKYVRSVARVWREKASKLQGNRELIQDFDFRLTNICLDVFEEHCRMLSLDSFKMLKDLEERLMNLAMEDKYSCINFERDFARGLVWEATSQCKFRWDNGKQ